MSGCFCEKLLAIGTAGHEITSISKESTSQKVLVGVAVPLVSAFILWLVPSLWALVKSGFSGLFSLLTYRITLHLWAVAIGALSLLAWTWKFYQANSTPVERESSWKEYTEDTIFDIRWDWRYDAFEDIRDVTPRCERDMTLLAPSGHEGGPIVLKCETCGEVRPFSISREELQQRVIRQIDRVIKTGEWKSKLQASQE